MIDGNVAIVMGEEKIKPQDKQANVGKLVTTRFTHVWKHADTNWNLIERQATIVKVE
jgi:ketosteroid isomerase-like protein